MGSLLTYVLDALVIAVVVVIIRKINLSTAKKTLLPPGPPAEWLIGHARMIPSEGQAEFFHEIGKAYGDVTYFKAFKRSIVVLNSAEAAIDLLNKRSSIYSDRPYSVMFEDILGMTSDLGSLGYGKRFQKHRKLFHSTFSQVQVHTYEDAQTEGARILLKDLMDAPESYNSLVARFSTTLVMNIAYGHQIVSDNDENINLAENLSQAFARSGSLVTTPPDLLPILRYVPAWVPGAWWSKCGRDDRKAIHDAFNVPFDRVREQMDKGTAPPSFVASHLSALVSEGTPTEEDIDDIRGAAGAIYSAGMETTWSTILMFIFTMTLFPDKLAKAQEEMDTVVGTDRLPEFSDRSSLPYLEAMLQEVLRWYPVVPLGVPHRVMQDDVYREMFIPKGSVVVANTFSMTRDERVYADAAKFYPERFLPKSTGGNEEPYPIGPFGFGRRTCPGRHLADTSVWIVLATMVATVTISRAKDEKGQEIVPDIAFDVAAVARPKPFKCTIAPRSDQARSLVMQVVPFRL